MESRSVERLLDFVGRAGVVRARDLDQQGIPRSVLNRLYENGRVSRVGWGLYVRADSVRTESRMLAEVCKRVPNGVICLLSALRVHGLVEECPREVWVAIDRKARRPSDQRLPMRIVRFSGDARLLGVEERRIEGVAVRVYNPAKTVADCFKYRRKIGVDVAIEALRRYCTSDDYTRSELSTFAEVCRVSRVMQPYMEVVGE